MIVVPERLLIAEQIENSRLRATINAAVTALSHGQVIPARRILAQETAGRDSEHRQSGARNGGAG